VCMFPAYQQLYSLPEACGAAVRLWKLDPDQGYRPDLDELERLLDSDVRLIVLNSPHNPTGTLLRAADLRRILSMAEGIDAYVLCDETYQGLLLQPHAEPVPPARSYGPRAISVSSLSKNMGLAGLRIGWVAATEDIVAGCWGYRDYVTISPSSLTDVLACLALDLRDALLERALKLARRNLGVLSQWMSEQEEIVEWVAPKAGLLSIPLP